MACSTTYLYSVWSIMKLHKLGFLFALVWFGDALLFLDGIVLR
jgi:hypothetical protein